MSNFDHQSTVRRSAFVSALLLIVCFFLFFVFSCRKDPEITPSEQTELPGGKIITSVKGFYLLNEGNMGMNRATLDYCEFGAPTVVYHRNIYAETNPSVVKELGDVGNDLKIYGSKLYAVINCSNLVEVMDAANARHITKFDVLNCRYITFHKDKAYVSSYAGPVQIGDKRIGLVIELDTVGFRETRRVEVGYQPEEMAVVNGKLYVANSGGYTATDYDRTVSVVDLQTFREIKKIDVAPNLHRLKADAYGDVYVSSRGDRGSVAPAGLYVIDTKTDLLKKSIDVRVGNFCIMGDTAYITGNEYRMVDVKTETLLSGNFISDGTDAFIDKPYGIAVDPISRNIYLTDAKNYVSSGVLYCFDKSGKMLWKTATGDIPAHIAFVTR